MRKRLKKKLKGRMCPKCKRIDKGSVVLWLDNGQSEFVWCFECGWGKEDFLNKKGRER